MSSPTPSAMSAEPPSATSSAKPCPCSRTKTRFPGLRQPATAQPQISSPPKQGTTRHIDSLRLHKVVNVLDCLPKSAQPAARKALAQIRAAEDREYAERAVTDFAAAYRAKYPKAVAKITGDQEQLLAFYDLPAEHWVHLKTSNPIESAFATVRLQTKVTKGPGSRAAGLAMVFKLIEAASERWRYVNGPHLVAPVRARAKFEKGVLVERPDEAEIKVAA